jgi:hypothetical protein
VPNDQNINPGEIRLRIQLSVEREIDQSYRISYVGGQKAFIRGQNVVLVVYKGTDRNATPIRKIMSTPFPGKGGRLMLGIIRTYSDLESKWKSTHL